MLFWVIVGVLALLLGGLPLIDLVVDGSLRRMATRNLTRRKGEAVLVVLGSMLGTAIIVSTFVVGDTFNASISDSARRELGPIDQVVELPGPDRVGELLPLVEEPPIPGVDGILTAHSAFAVVSVQEGIATEPRVRVGELSFEDGRAFGPDEAITGLADAGATPTGNEVVINDRIAEELDDVEAGDRLSVSLYGATLDLRIRQVLPEVGLAGSAGLLLPPGTISSLFAEFVAGAGASAAGLAEQPSSQVLVSNDGGVFDSVEGSAAVVRELESRVEGVEGAGVDPIKDDLLEQAEETGAELQGLFTIVGSFSILAGIALLVNLFVMLTEERKQELGMLRAVGLKRFRLVRLFNVEGLLYALAAAATGALAGVGVGWAIIQATKGIFAEEGMRGGALQFQLTIEPASLARGALIGFVIAMVTIVLTSSRIARLNVISAIRDLPDPRRAGARGSKAIVGAFGLVAGLLLFLGGLSNDEPFGLMLGVPIAATSAVPILSLFLKRKLAVILGSTVALVWGLLVFTMFSDAMSEVDEMIFVIQGLVLVLPAVRILGVLDRVWSKAADLLAATGRGLSARLGLAYPLARQFRTSLIVFMFAIVVFVITFLTVLTSFFASQADEVAANNSAGFELIVEVNPANPPSPDAVEAVQGVAVAAPVLRAFPEFTSDVAPEGRDWPASGLDSIVADGDLVLLGRDDAFDTDQEAIDAVLDAPTDAPLVLVDEGFLQGEAGPPEGITGPGDEVTITNTFTGQTFDATVAGLVESDFTFRGAFISEAFLRGNFADRVSVSQYYVTSDDQTSTQVLADRLNSELKANGVDAQTFVERVNEFMATNNGFFTLMRGFLALGLVIGIAGLGVVMIRAVRERRREIGMLRAMGFSEGLVRSAFVLEAAFIALQGIVLGIVLGAFSSNTVIGGSDAFGSSEGGVQLPWLGFAILAVVPLVAALLATLAPAVQAARIRPAVALRIAE